MEDFIEIADAVSDPTSADVVEMIVRFMFNFLVVLGLSRFVYYPRGRRKDYLFVFVIMSMSIFLMVYLLGSLKLKIGFALGLFAIFGIVRYRTEQMPVREMTYLFVIIALSVINALSHNISTGQLLLSNFLLSLAIWASEREFGLKDVRSKLIVYDDISKIRPDQRDELIGDLKLRTGLKVVSAEVGHIDFIRDMAVVRLFYEADSFAPTSTDIEEMTKLPR